MRPPRSRNACRAGARPSPPRGERVAIALLAAIFATGCAGDYIARTGGVRQSYETYDHGRALEELDDRTERELARIEDLRHPDSLLYYMDRGMILHAAGSYEESNAAFHQAERIAAALDIVSVSEEAGTLATSQSRRAYRGESFEHVLINVYKALNFAALGERESALVEVRRVDERLRLIAGEERKAGWQLAVARYVGGILWESAGELDSAFIDYRYALESAGELGHLAEPLLRLARATGRDEEYARLVERYPGISHEPLGPDEGQVVMVVSAGLSPVKKPTVREGEVDVLALSYYQPRRWSGDRARVRISEREQRAVALTSVERVAMRRLDQRRAGEVGRGVAGTAVKAGVARAVGAATKSEDAGLLAFSLLMLANRPDLRSWLSLPAEIQVARMRVPAGEHVIEVRLGSQRTTHEVLVRPGEITIVPIRRY